MKCVKIIMALLTLISLSEVSAMQPQRSLIGTEFLNERYPNPNNIPPKVQLFIDLLRAGDIKGAQAILDDKKFKIDSRGRAKMEGMLEGVLAQQQMAGTIQPSPGTAQAITTQPATTGAVSNELALLRQQNFELTNLIQKKDAELKNSGVLPGLNQKLEEQVEKLQREKENLIADKAVLQTNFTTLEANLNTSREERNQILEKREEENKAAQEARESTQQENEGLKRILGETQKAITDKEKQCTAIATANAQLNEEIKALRNDIAARSADVNLKEVNAKLMSDNNSLQAALKKKEEDSLAKEQESSNLKNKVISGEDSLLQYARLFTGDQDSPLRKFARLVLALSIDKATPKDIQTLLKELYYTLSYLIATSPPTKKPGQEDDIAHLIKGLQAWVKPETMNQDPARTAPDVVNRTKVKELYEEDMRNLPSIKSTGRLSLPSPFPSKPSPKVPSLEVTKAAAAKAAAETPPRSISVKNMTNDLERKAKEASAPSPSATPRQPRPSTLPPIKPTPTAQPPKEVKPIPPPRGEPTPPPTPPLRTTSRPTSAASSRAPSPTRSGASTPIPPPPPPPALPKTPSGASTPSGTSLPPTPESINEAVAVYRSAMAGDQSEESKDQEASNALLAEIERDRANEKAIADAQAIADAKAVAALRPKLPFTPQQLEEARARFSTIQNPPPRQTTSEISSSTPSEVSSVAPSETSSVAGSEAEEESDEEEESDDPWAL